MSDITIDATQLVDLVTLKVDGPCVLFIRIDPAKMTDVYVASITRATEHVMRQLRVRGLQFIIAPKDIDLAVVGEAQLEKLGLMRIPAPLIADGAVNESERSL